jgi:penicillin-binding protein 1A
MRVIVAKLLRIRLLRRLLGVVVLLAAFAVGGVAAGLAMLARDLPQLSSLEDYDPPTTSRVYDAGGNLVARFYKERRTVVPVERIPPHVKNAFIAAEDADFYQHEGVDWGAVVAAVANELKVKLVGGSRRGGSTITQQTAKTFLLSPEQTYSRKLKEMLLAKRIEDQLTKDEILHLYLNQIYFGHGAYGVEEAARTYYGRSVTKLTLGQAAALASVPKSPNRINPFSDPARVRSRRGYVLKQMVENGLTDEKDAQAAREEPVRVHVEPPEYLDSAPYYAEAIRRELSRSYGDDVVNAGGLKVYAALDARLQVAANKAVKEGLRAVDKRQGWREPLVRLDPDEIKPFLEAIEDERTRRFPPEETPELSDATAATAPIWDLQGLTTKKVQQYIGVMGEAGPPVEPAVEGEDGADDAPVARWPAMRSVRTTQVKVGRIVGGLVKRIDNSDKRAIVDLGTIDAVISMTGMKWARKYSPTKLTKAPRKPGDVLKKGDVVLVRLDKVVTGREDKGGKSLRPWVEATLEQEPKVEGALVAVDPHSRRVLALVGGYDFERSSFNRATQAKRQPGSSFKPFIYALGLEQKQFTPVGFLDGQGSSRLVTDAPKVFFDRWTGKKWAPKNSGGRFRGDITLRTCLTYSVNTCSLTILEKTGVEPVHELARKVGVLTEETPFPKNLTLALGTGEVRPLDLVNAYTIFPAGGGWAPPVLIEKAKQANGKVLQESQPDPVQVLSPATSFVMSEMMKSVVENGTGMRAKALERPVAGKTGTTNQARSVWFVGFTPDIVAGAYVGFDDNSPLGHREYGGKAALPIWLDFMREAVREQPERDFAMPEGVVKRTLDARTGLLFTDASAAVVSTTAPTSGDAPDAPAPSSDVEQVDAPEPEEGELPAGAIIEYFVEGTEPMLTAEETAPPPLEMIEGAGGLGP